MVSVFSFFFFFLNNWSEGFLHPPPHDELLKVRSRHKYRDCMLRIQARYHVLMTREAHVHSSVDHIRPPATGALGHPCHLARCWECWQSPRAPSLLSLPHPTFLTVGSLAWLLGAGQESLERTWFLTHSVPTYLAIYRNHQGNKTSKEKDRHGLHLL